MNTTTNQATETQGFDHVEARITAGAERPRVDATPENLSAFESGKKHMAAMVGALDDAALRKVWRLTVMLIEKSSGGVRKAELLGERLAIQEEALRRGYTLWQLAALWS